jgi:hypothetical protein
MYRLPAPTPSTWARPSLGLEKRKMGMPAMPARPISVSGVQVVPPSEVRSSAGAEFSS